MEEYRKSHSQEDEGAGRWLSCESDLGVFRPARRKRKVGSSRRPILLQKKLPRHWRERDDTLLTELDLLQPEAGALKQSSLMSFIAVGEMSKPGHPHDLHQPQGVRDSNTSPESEESKITGLQWPCLNESQTSPISQVKGRHFVAESSLVKLDPLSSGLEQHVDDENSSSDGRFLQSFDVKEPRFKQDSGSRRFTTLNGNKVLSSNTLTVSADLCLKDHHKNVHFVPVKDKVDVETCDEADVVGTIPGRLAENGEVGVADSFECSQKSSSSMDDFSDQFDLCDSDGKFRDGKLHCGKEVRDSTRKEQKFPSRPAEESWTVTDEVYHPFCSNSPLTESQKARKEIYKAEMGSLHFSEFSDLP